jgi:hypothetical protein
MSWRKPEQGFPGSSLGILSLEGGGKGGGGGAYIVARSNSTRACNECIEG